LTSYHHAFRNNWPHVFSRLATRKTHSHSSTLYHPSTTCVAYGFSIQSALRSRRCSAGTSRPIRHRYRSLIRTTQLPTLWARSDTPQRRYQLHSRLECLQPIHESASSRYYSTSVPKPPSLCQLDRLAFVRRMAIDSLEIPRHPSHLSAKTFRSTSTRHYLAHPRGTGFVHPTRTPSSPGHTHPFSQNNKYTSHSFGFDSHRLMQL